MQKLLCEWDLRKCGRGRAGIVLLNNLHVLGEERDLMVLLAWAKNSKELFFSVSPKS